LLFTVELDGLTLTDGMAAYGRVEDPLLPIGELARLLELDIEVLPAERRVLGRIGEARRSLIIDLNTGTARDGPRVVPLAAEDIVVTPTEIYARTSALQRLLPLKIVADGEALNIEITALELLPIQGRLQRMARRREAGQEPQGNNEVLKVETPYGLLSLPAFDMALGVGGQSMTPHFPLRYDIRIGADALYTGFQGYLGSDETGRLSTARAFFERRSLEGRLLGGLKARSVMAGDVFTPPLSLGPRSVGGRGFAFSTVPLDQTNVFNRIDLRGELPLGYDVELYVNDILRSGQNTPTKGRYEFLSVPLSQGINIVRIVTYGPRGDRSEQTRVVNVGGGQLKKGEATLEVGAVQQDEPLFLVRPLDEAEVRPPGSGGLRVVANANYGLTQFMTIAAGAALIPGKAKDDLRQLGTIGARTSIFGFATNLDLAYDSTGASAVSLGLAGEILGVSTILRHAQFQGGFIDENGPGVDLDRAMSSRSEVTFDGNIAIGANVIPVSLRAMQNTYTDGLTDVTGSARASATAKGILFSAGLEYQRLFGSTFSNERLSGYFAGSTFRSYKWQLRSTLDFDVLPKLKARALAITADRDISDLATLRFGVGQPLDDLRGTNFTAATIFKLRYADVSLTADYNNQDRSWRAGMQVNFGLSYNPAEGGYQMTRPGPGSGGSMLFEAFLDRNGNGIFDEGDSPVPNVGVDGGEREAVTGADGRVFLTGVGAGPTARVLVNLDNVANNSVQTPPTTVQFTPRPGSFTTVRYPMRPTGEVMVTISLRRPDGQLVGLSAAQIRLVGDNGHIAEASTEFDGSVNFQDLPTGTYRLELDPAQAGRLRMSLAAPLSITIKDDGDFVPDAAAEVRFAPRPEETPKETAALE
jgi:hypothetical protein